MRRGVGQILRDLCRQEDLELVEGKATPDHIHMLLSVPPKSSIAMTIGYLKGKGATRIHRELLHTEGTLFGRSFWARGYRVSTVGLDEGQIRRSIREQEKLQRDRDRGGLNLESPNGPFEGPSSYHRLCRWWLINRGDGPYHESRERQPTRTPSVIFSARKNPFDVGISSFLEIPVRLFVLLLHRNPARGPSPSGDGGIAVFP
jgi:putative transposase